MTFWKDAVKIYPNGDCCLRHIPIMRMNWMKKTGDIGQLFVELREIVITAKQQIVYESCYAI